VHQGGSPLARGGDRFPAVALHVKKRNHMGDASQDGAGIGDTERLQVETRRI
jgi:hypothetical protein